MSEQDALDRILASLYDAMLDDARWPDTSALIDQACGLTGNALAVGEGPRDDTRVAVVGTYYRGQRREDVEREYLETYHPTDERVPRLRQRPYGRLMHVSEQYTSDQLKRSRTYNDFLIRVQYGNSLLVILEGLDGSCIGWSMGDPVASDSWGASQIAMLTGLAPQIRQFVLVRQALVRAAAPSTTVTALLDNPRIGAVHLDRRGRILAANDRARGMLRRGDGVSDRDGVLHVRAPDARSRFERLVAAALPTSGSAAAGSMLLPRASLLSPLLVHLKPVPVPQPDYGARHVAAVALFVEPGHQHRIEPDLVATTLGLTQAESQVAVRLAEGRTAREIAEITGHTRGAVYWHLKQIYQKLAVSRQADLVRLVLSIGQFG